MCHLKAPNQTYKLEESQQGSVDITINGKKTSIIKDLAPFKDKISKHKDIKVDVTVVDKDITVPAVSAPSLEVLKAIADSNKDTELLKVNIPEEFRSPDQQATMTPEEILSSIQVVSPQIHTLEGLGINLPPVKKHTIITFEIPPTLPMNEGIKDIDTMSDEEIEKLSDAIITGGKKAGSTLVATLISLGGTSSKRIFWKQQLWKGKFSITSGLNGSKLIHFYGTPSLTSMLEGVTDPKMIEKIKKAAINPGTKYKMGKGFAGIQLKASLPFFEGTKLGYLEKFLNGKTAMGGVVVASIFSGTMETYKWYHNKERQDIDLLAIWGVVIAKTLIGAGIVSAAIAIAIGAFSVSSIVVIIGVGVAFAVIGGFGIETIASYLDINNKATQAVRSARDSAKEFINDATDSLMSKDINLDKSLIR